MPALCQNRTGFIRASPLIKTTSEERRFVRPEHLTGVGLWCRGNEVWLGDTREERSHHHWMRRCRGRGRFITLNSWELFFSRREMVRKRVSEMVTCCTTTRRNDYFSTQQHFEVSLSPSPSLFFFFSFSLLHWFTSSYLCSAKGNLTLIWANECWIWERGVFWDEATLFSGENLQCKWCG